MSWHIFNAFCARLVQTHRPKNEIVLQVQSRNWKVWSGQESSQRKAHRRDGNCKIPEQIETEEFFVVTLSG